MRIKTYYNSQTGPLYILDGNVITEKQYNILVGGTRKKTQHIIFNNKKIGSISIKKGYIDESLLDSKRNVYRITNALKGTSLWLDIPYMVTVKGALSVGDNWYNEESYKVIKNPISGNDFVIKRIRDPISYEPYYEVTKNNLKEPRIFKGRGKRFINIEGKDITITYESAEDRIFNSIQMGDVKFNHNEQVRFDLSKDEKKVTLTNTKGMRTPIEIEIGKPTKLRIKMLQSPRTLTYFLFFKIARKKFINLEYEKETELPGFWDRVVRTSSPSKSIPKLLEDGVVIQLRQTDNQNIHWQILNSLEEKDATSTTDELVTDKSEQIYGKLIKDFKQTINNLTIASYDAKSFTQFFKSVDDATKVLEEATSAVPEIYLQESKQDTLAYQTKLKTFTMVIPPYISIEIESLD